MGSACDVVVDGVRLVYDVHGEPGAEPMVLLHALGENRDDWAPVSGLFAERFRVHAVDLRGHGDSDRPGDYSFGAMRDDVIGLLDRLGLTAVTLVGHSMGGVVAILLALARPDLVGRLVVEDAAPPYRRDRPVPPRPDGPLTFDWAVAPAIIGAVNAGDDELWAALPTVAAPTLVIGGGPASHVPQDKVAETAELIPGASFVTIPAGHLVHAEQPAEFAEAVLTWSARHR